MYRYRNIPQTKSPSGKQMYKTVRYPEIPRSFSDIYVTTTLTDRYDILAQQYYQDSTLWWIISVANNNLTQNSLRPPAGKQIRIPSNPTPYIVEYNKINR